MAGIDWTETLAEAKQRANDERRLMMTYIFSPG